MTSTQTRGHRSAGSASVLRAERPPRLAPLEYLPLTLIVVVAAVVWGVHAWQVDEWRVMTDELLYVKLAQGIGDSLSPLPQVRSEPYAHYSQLYPLLLSPLVGFFDMPTAFKLAHILNALLMASTAVPTYLLARILVPWRPASLAAAALAVAVPWMLLSFNLMPEAAGYPAFTWAVYAIVVALADPRPRHDVLAIVAVVVAYLARTQLIVLVPLIPVLVVLHELGYRLAITPAARWFRCILPALGASVRNHPVLAVTAVATAVLTLLSSALLPIGSYGHAVGSHKLFPNGLLDSLFDHLNLIVLGTGVLPLVLAAAWTLETLIRPASRTAHAFAVTLVPAILVVAYVGTWFDVTEAASLQERYVFYFAPLLFVGAVACLFRVTRPLLSIGVAAVLSAVLILQTQYEPIGPLPVFASPVKQAYLPLGSRASQVGRALGLNDLAAGLVIVICMVAACLIVAVLLRRHRPRIALVGVTLVAMSTSVALTVYAHPRLKREPESLALGSLGPRPLESRDWIDEAVPEGATVGLLTSPINSRGDQEIVRATGVNLSAWWEPEFWNKSVDRVFSFRGAHPYSPFDFTPLELEPSGRLAAEGAPADYLVVATSNVRLAPAAAKRPQVTGDVGLYRPRRPYRAAWVTEGVSNNGTLRGGRATLVLFPDPGRGWELRRVEMLLVPGVAGSYKLRGADLERTGALEVTTRIAFTTCVSSPGPGRVGLQISPGASARVAQIIVEPLSRPCRPARVPRAARS